MTGHCTRSSLAADLNALGAEAGDVLFVHSSFKSLGPIGGGAEVIVGALLDVLGSEGTLLMPAFNLVEGGNEGRAANWDLETTPSTVGYITDSFRQMSGTLRSDHYSHSVAARGRNAAEFVADHQSDEGMRSPWDRAPWGRTYGTQSPMLKAYRHARGKILMLGVDYRSSTYCHVVETMSWNRRLQYNPDAKFRWLDREKAGVYWDELGRLARGKVGDADCRLFTIRAFVDALLAAVEKEPERWFK